MSKKVAIGTKPTALVSSSGVDAWVDKRATVTKSEPYKRLTIDIPASLHRRLKSQCALSEKPGETKMADVVRDLLLQKYGND